MAIITISRQLASLGDEIGQETAKKLGYNFVTKKDIERKLIDSGFSEEELKKYDERKPTFFSSLTRKRDEYLDHLKTVLYKTASQGNCIFIGRGAAYILNGIENHLSTRFMCDPSVRIQRVMEEFEIDTESAKKIIKLRDKKQIGYYKSFFSADIAKSAPFHLVLNTGLLDVDTASSMLAAAVKSFETPQKEQAGKERLAELLIAQNLVNMLLLDYDIAIHFLRAEISGTQISLYGIADSRAIVERALTICRLEVPELEVKSYVKVVQDSRF